MLFSKGSRRITFRGCGDKSIVLLKIDILNFTGVICVHFCSPNVLVNGRSCPPLALPAGAHAIRIHRTEDVCQKESEFLRIFFENSVFYSPFVRTPTSLPFSVNRVLDVFRHCILVIILNAVQYRYLS